MSKKDKSILIIDFWERILTGRYAIEIYCLQGNRKLYKKFLQGKSDIPNKSQYKTSKLDNKKGDTDKYELQKMNDMAYKDTILSINEQIKLGNVAFNLVDNCVKNEQLDGNYKLAWKRLVHKYTPKTVPYCIQLKKDFANGELESSDIRPENGLMISRVCAQK